MKRTYFTSVLSLSLLFAFCIFAGCEKENTTNDHNNSTVSAIPVIISMSDSINSSGRGSSETKSFSPESIKTATGNINLTGTLELSEEAQTRSTSLTSGIRYRIVAYKENNITPDGYVSHADYVVGTTAPALYLPSYSSYTLVCYSYGTTTTLPDFDKSSTSITTSPDTDDFMYCKKNITIKGEECYLSAVLSHLFSKVTVIVSSTDGFNIMACSGTISPSYKASVSLADGGSIKDSNVSGGIVWNSINSATITSNPALVYTNTEMLTCNLSSITFAQASGNVTVSNKTFTFTGKTMQGGRNYTLRIALEKALYITLAGSKWALGNLIESWGQYSIAGNQETGGTGFSFTNDVDWCNNVSPTGTWRTPRYSELVSLVSTNNVRGVKNGVDGYYFGTSSIPTDPDNYVFLPMDWRYALNYHVISSGYWGSFRDVSQGCIYFYYRSFGITGKTFSKNEVPNYKFYIRCVYAK